MSETVQQEPEELRRDIARTRADMDRTLAELEDRVTPSRIRERQTERVRSRWRRTREAVMGSSGDGPAMRDRLSNAAEGTGESVREAPQRVEEVTRGNPMAAGLVAFGVGALAGSLLPSSRSEQAVASELRDQFEEPVRSELQQAGQEVSSELRDHAQRAVEETKQTARQGMERTQEQAKESGQQVREHARASADTVREQSDTSGSDPIESDPLVRRDTSELRDPLAPEPSVAAGDRLDPPDPMTPRDPLDPPPDPLDPSAPRR